MNNQSSPQLFRHQDHQLAYVRMGAGPQVALAFHGFGQTSAVYEPLADSVGAVYTIYAIDLFLHGNSTRANTACLSKKDWCDLIEAFLAQQAVGQFTLMGYSLGGRFALVLTERFATRLDQLILMAPDGVRFSPWYGLATQTTVGRAVFRYAMQHLPLLHQAGRRLIGLGLLRPSLLRFAEVSLHTPQQRQLVYDAWTQFRYLKPDLHRIAAALAGSSVSVHLIAGIYDQIIPPGYLLPLTRLLKRYTLTQLLTGHNRLIDKSGTALINH